MSRARDLAVACLLLVSGGRLVAQSPHGAALTVDCSACHISEGWNVMRDSLLFDHGVTRFPLEGVHKDVDCRSCHTSLVFNEGTPSSCAACHADVHSMSVGDDCARCHTPNTWLVDDIPELHEQNGFALIGVHATVSCTDCHVSDNPLNFTRLGNDCINCHRADYDATSHPDHAEAGYSTDCTQCHDPFGTGWTTQTVDHDFFPLTQGHDIQDCARCHTSGQFSDASPECVSCHLPDYNATSGPSHVASGFSTDCASCHTIGGWTPATFDHDSQFFPIHSGAHNGVWSACTECHPNPNDYSVFTCTSCHTNPQTDNDHGGMPGYVYESNACLACHPNGDANGAFDHNTTDFPLQGGHVGVNCIECHSGGYQGTPTNCDACHMDDYNATTNPNHNGAQFPTDCAQCHNESSWTPANFDHDNDYFPIYSGNHNGEWNACSDCHTNNNDYSVFSCIICHDDQAGLADDHSGENGYAFNSNACFNCHPNGN